MKSFAFIIIFAFFILDCVTHKSNNLFDVVVEGPYTSEYLHKINVLDADDTIGLDALDGHLYTAFFSNKSSDTLNVYVVEKNTIHINTTYLNEDMSLSNMQNIEENMPIEFMKKILLSPKDSKTFVFYLNVPVNIKFLSIVFDIVTLDKDTKFIRMEKTYSNDNGYLTEL